jgi:hypothetical protein
VEGLAVYDRGPGWRCNQVCRYGSGCLLVDLDINLATYYIFHRETYIIRVSGLEFLLYFSLYEGYIRVWLSYSLTSYISLYNSLIGYYNYTIYLAAQIQKLYITNTLLDNRPTYPEDPLETYYTL